MHHNTSIVEEIFFLLHHAKKKADVFQKGVIKTALEEMHDDNDPKNLEHKPSVCLLYFGFHRRHKMLQIQVKHVKLS